MGPPEAPGMFAMLKMPCSSVLSTSASKDPVADTCKVLSLRSQGERGFFLSIFLVFFVSFLAFSCFSCGFQNMPSWFCLSSSSGGNSFLCVFLVFLVNFAGFQLPMASQRHRVSGTGPNLNVLQQHITSNPSSFCNSRLERRGCHRWLRQDSKAS